MTECEKVKHFSEALFESLWICVNLAIGQIVTSEFDQDITEIFERLSETHQVLLLRNIINVINTTPNLNVLRTLFTFTSKIKLKVSYHSFIITVMNFIIAIS